MLSQQDVNAIIEAAIFAPSADNSLPFLFDYDGQNTIKFFTDETRSGKATDQGFALSDIALGAVLENAIIKGSSLGYDCDIQYFPDIEHQPRHIANVTFTKAATPIQPNPLDQAITERCTDRRFPFKGPVQQEVITRLQQAAEFHQCELAIYDNKASKQMVLPVIQKAETIRFESQLLHQELFSTVDFENPTPAEGMPVSTLAIEAPARPFFKLMSKWKYMNFFNKLGGSKMLGLRSVKVPIAFSPLLVLLKIPSNSRRDVIRGGQALQRIWLQAAADKLAVQPYAAPGVFSLGHLQIEKPLMPRLAAVQQEMANIVENKGYGLMFLRMGYNSPVTNRTLRRPLESYRMTPSNS